jgi:Tripartite tricarboxylate transporter TctB family
MMSDTARNRLVSLIVLSFFLIMLVWSEQIAHQRGRDFPILVSAAGAVLGLIDLIAHSGTAFGERLALVLSGAARIQSEQSYGFRREMIAILWIVAATAVMVLAGFLAAIPLYVFGYMLLHARRTVWQGAIAALATTVAIWAGFELLLSYDLYRGVLFQN